MQNIKNYKFGKVLGVTPTSTVLEAINLQNSQECAIKYYRIHSKTSQEYQALYNEVVILARANHPNFVKFLGYAEINCFDEILEENFLAFYVIMEKMDIDLKKMIKQKQKQKEFFSLEEFRNFIADTFSVMQFLEEEGIPHQDIKPANILYKEGKFKMADIKSSPNYCQEAGSNEKSQKNQIEGTLIYFSPEKLQSILK